SATRASGAETTPRGWPPAARPCSHRTRAQRPPTSAASGRSLPPALVIESVFSNLKEQMRLERHLARTPARLAVRIAQRILALTLECCSTPSAPAQRALSQPTTAAETHQASSRSTSTRSATVKELANQLMPRATLGPKWERRSPSFVFGGSWRSA